MLKTLSIWALFAATLLAGGSAQAAIYRTVAQSAADGSGAGTIQLEVGAGDPDSIAATLKEDLALSHDAIVESVTVEGGVATITYYGAPAGAAVTAALPESTILALGVLGGGAGSGGTAAGGGAAGGFSTAGLVGGGVLVAGGIAGAAVETDGFSESGQEFVSSPSQ